MDSLVQTRHMCSSYAMSVMLWVQYPHNTHHYRHCIQYNRDATTLQRDRVHSAHQIDPTALL